MMRSFKLILFFVLMCLLSEKASAVTFADETLNYVISYKWGLIHKDAGEATLKLDNTGDSYSLRLTVRTKPWADKFYQVRDTLIGKVKKNGFLPISYSKIAHEKGKYSRDDIAYSYQEGKVAGIAKRVRLGKDGNLKVTDKQLYATGKAFDMLSVFYFLRMIDYSNLSAGEMVKTTVFSGSKVESLTIRCIGRENVKMRNGSKRDAWHIRFKFTQDGKKKSSEDIDAWISTDEAHVPLLVVGGLPVGQVKCYLVSA